MIVNPTCGFSVGCRVDRTKSGSCLIESESNLGLEGVEETLDLKLSHHLTADRLDQSENH